MKKRLLFITAFLFANSLWAKEDTRPNIIWMVSEDNGARWLGCYGNPRSPTPNLDKLAEEGFRYTRCFASVGVCAPQRFTWITGINAISAGTQNMRSGVNLPEGLRFYPEIFKELGYYTSKGDDAKTDYNFRGRNANDTWDDSKKINWENLKENQPFIHVFNTHDTHEWNSFGRFKPEKDKAPKAENLASYHPDVPEMHFVYEKYNQAHMKMDQRVAGWLQDLEDSGLAEDTIVIYSSDHGGVLPRSKRFLYNSGTHCPLIVRIPEKFKALYPAAKPGMTVDELVSFVDFPKTWLSLGGADEAAVEQMQGRVFLGESKDPEPEQVFSFRQRMDDRYDMVRSARDEDFLYIRNYMPFVPMGQYLDYNYNSVSIRAWRKHYLDGHCDAVTGRFFERSRAVDELYRYEEDYDNVNNLAMEPTSVKRIEAMRAALKVWQLKIFDSGFLPEDEMARAAKAADLTVYDFVRDPALYPLEEYIDMADRSLSMNPENLNGYLETLKNEDLGMRYWATLGILNLTLADDAADIPEVKEAMRSLLQDDSQVIQAYAAWVLVRVGEDAEGLAFLQALSQNTYTPRTVLNILDWMDSKKALPLIRSEYLEAAANEKEPNKVLVAKLMEQSLPDFKSLLEQSEKLRHRSNAIKGRMKKLAKTPGKLTDAEVETETLRLKSELQRVSEDYQVLVENMRTAS